MQQLHDVSPFARPFVRSSATHQGQSFMQRLTGRGPDGARTPNETSSAGATEADWPDLDQRVRNVGEW